MEKDVSIPVSVDRKNKYFIFIIVYVILVDNSKLMMSLLKIDKNRRIFIFINYQNLKLKEIIQDSDYARLLQLKQIFINE